LKVSALLPSGTALSNWRVLAEAAIQGAVGERHELVESNRGTKLSAA
jgi:hypothetical protein